MELLPRLKWEFVLFFPTPLWRISKEVNDMSMVVKEKSHKLTATAQRPCVILSRSLTLTSTPCLSTASPTTGTTTSTRRHCSYGNKTLLHVLFHCRRHHPSNAWQHRHGKGQNCLTKVIPASAGTRAMNRALANTGSQLSSMS